MWTLTDTRYRSPWAIKGVGHQRGKSKFSANGAGHVAVCTMASASLAANRQNFREENRRSHSHNAATVHAKEPWFGIWSATCITLLTRFPKFEAQLWREAHVYVADVETCSVHMRTRYWPGEVFPTYSALDKGGCCLSINVYPLRKSKEQQ